MNTRRLTDMDAVFFDAGFTLLDLTRPAVEVYWAEAVRSDPDLPEAAFRTRFADQWKRVNQEFRSAHPELRSSEQMEREAWRRFSRRVAEPFPVLLEQHEAWLQRLFAWFDSPAAWQPAPGVGELLDQLAAADVAVGVVSNWHTALHEILREHGLAENFVFCLTSAEAGRKKPHPEIFQQAVAKMGVAAAATAHVGDSWEDDVCGAAAAGLTPVWLHRGKKPPSDSSPSHPAAETVWMVKELADLAAINPESKARDAKTLR